MSLAFVFPGQGSQSIGMMNGWSDLAVVKATFDEASGVLGEDMWAMASEGPLEAINAFAAFVCVWCAFVQTDINPGAKAF